MTPSDPWTRQLPDGPWDTVVIGSGIGSLTTAAMLSKLGRRVLVLERHLRPGGLTQTFRRGAARWDVGVHIVGEMGKADFPGRLLERLSDGGLRWASIGETVDRVVDETGVVASLPAGLDAMVAAMDAAAPGSAREARRYLEESRRISGALGRALLARSIPEASRGFSNGGDLQLAAAAMLTPARTALTQLPEALRPLMGMRWGYVGTPLDTLCWAALASTTAHFIDGGWYPVGGAGEIARTLGRVIAAAGGAIVVGCGVAEVLVEGGRAIGVRTEGEAGQRVLARNIVSGIGAPATVDRLLADPPADWAAAIRALPLSLAHTALYLALDTDPRAWGGDGANVWGVDPGTREVGWYASFPSLRDPTWTGPHLASIIRLVPWADHAEISADGRSEAYRAYKGALAESLLDRVATAIPGLRAHIVHQELATPATVIRYIDAPEAATYGLASSGARFRSPALAARTPIPGLYLTGSDVAMPGVVGAMIGGAAAGVAIGGGPALRILLDAARTERTT